MTEHLKWHIVRVHARVCVSAVTHSLKLCCQDEDLEVEIRVLTCVEVVLTCHTPSMQHMNQATGRVTQHEQPISTGTQWDSPYSSRSKV